MVTLKEAESILGGLGFSIRSRSGDGKFRWYNDLLEGKDTTIHAELEVNKDGFVEQVEFSSIIGLMTLSTYKFSITHPRISWFIETLRSSAYAAECTRIRLLERQKGNRLSNGS